MTELHKKMTETDVKKLFWCARAAKYLEDNKYMSFQEGMEYAEVLYFEYVEMRDEIPSPEETVKEDITYW